MAKPINKRIQEIYICMDDSGKLNKNEDYTVYAGLIFIGRSSRDKFINKYRKAISSFNCKYCPQSEETCDKVCPEIKSNGRIKKSHRRQLLNLIKKRTRYAVVIKNKDVHEEIMNSKSSRGRFTDYTQKRIIKESFKKLINLKLIDPQGDVHLFLYIDEQPTVSNGYYELDKSIIEEFSYGIKNFNYDAKFEPILFKGFKLTLKYKDSSRNYDVQSADMLAGSIRKVMVSTIPYEEKVQNIHDLTDVFKIIP